MAIVTEPAHDTIRHIDVAPAEHKVRPVVVWATIGAIFLAIEAYAVIGWVSGPNFKRTPTGVTPVPGWEKIVLDSWQILGIPAFFLFVYHFLVKPWRKEGHITTDGLLVLVFATLWWQDPLSNWAAPYFTYNSAMINFGSWNENLPGWLMPHANKIAEPTLWTDPIYVYLVFGAAVVGSLVMRRIKARWPQMSPWGVLASGFVAFMLFDALLEPILMALGFWAYPGPVRALTLWSGTRFQFPLYEAVFWGGVWTLWSAVRYFRNDKGETVAERGIDEVRASTRTKTWIRFLALAGVCNFIFMFGYNVPLQFFVAHQSNWNANIVNRSYLTDGVCGPNTSYACPGPAVPLPNGNGSASVGPNGNLIVPNGSSLPTPVQQLTKTP